MSAILTVLRKEIRENLRDRRTLLSALLYGPLIGPCLFVLMLGMMIVTQQNNAGKPLEIPVAGADHAPALMTELRQHGLVPVPLRDTPVAMINSHRADVVLRIPSSYAGQWRQGRPAEVELYYDSTQRGVHTTIARVQGLLTSWSRTQGMLRLLARGIAPETVSPLVVANRDQATSTSRAARFLSFLPYFYMIALFYGGMYLANDLTAGERERQSLEPLFANPVARWRILVGKLGAVCAFALASLLICLIGIAVVVRLVPAGQLDVTLDLGVGFCAFSLLLLLPLATLIAVAQTLVAAFARSYREAQSYLQIMMVVLIIPSILMSFVPMKVTSWMYLVPVMGQQLGITELLRGDTPGLVPVLSCLVGSSVATLVLGWITAYVYRSERLAISA